MRRDDGQITAFVVAMTATLILVAGLVIDGGRVLVARLKAINEAQEAARAGAQSINLATYRRHGDVTLDPAAAASTARRYLAAAGATGTVSIRGDQVTVTVTRIQDTPMLHVVGIPSIRVRAVGSAHPVRGINTVIP